MFGWEQGDAGYLEAALQETPAVAMFKAFETIHQETLKLLSTNAKHLCIHRRDLPPAINTHSRLSVYDT